LPFADSALFGIVPLRLPLQLLIAIACCASMSASGHPPMTHDCLAPTRPADDQNDELWRRFLVEIDVFQSCVTAEADRHQLAATAHQQAALEAVDAWNQFVRSSLNVPEDFPWPPEEK